MLFTFTSCPFTLRRDGKRREVREWRGREEGKCWERSERKERERREQCEGRGERGTEGKESDVKGYAGERSEGKDGGKRE